VLGLVMLVIKAVEALLSGQVRIAQQTLASC
jgi:hypothetical protein